MLGQHTFFHFETQPQPDETLQVVLKQSPRPVIAVPAVLAAGQVVVVAYDGSLHAARALQMLQVLGLEGSQEVHVVCVDPDQEHADRCVERAVAFLHSHNIVARAYARATEAAPADVLLEHLHRVPTSLLVMGAYGRSTIREFFGGSVTRTMLHASPVPLFLYH
jgi:nucleotide-binding universal stress UspA family protein